VSVYIYEDVEQITTNWHDGGRVVVVTDREPNAAWAAHLAAVAAEHPSNSPYLDETKITQELPEPTRVIATPPGEPEAVFVFPDSGCCCPPRDTPAVPRRGFRASRGYPDPGHAHDPRR